MARLIDPQRLAAYMDAIGNGHLHGPETAYRWIRNKLGITTGELKLRICEYVKNGGHVDEVKEGRHQWADHEYHYDLRFEIDQTNVYIETRLIARFPVIPDQPYILVVNIHDP